MNFAALLSSLPTIAGLVRSGYDAIKSQNPAASDEEIFAIARANAKLGQTFVDEWDAAHPEVGVK